MTITRALTFPGQGSQAIAMGKEFYDNFDIAKQTFLEVDNALNQKLSDLIFTGEIEELTKTENAQPALMACSLAIFRTILAESGKKISDICGFVAGHSLGEYSALAAAGSLSISDAAKILRIRGNAMNEASLGKKGAMAAIIGADVETVENLVNEAREDEICQIANDNSVGQIVISGDDSAIDRAIKIAASRGIKRAIKLPVSGAFHSDLIKDAKPKMAEALNEITINAPAVPLIANVTADEINDVQEIKKLLVEQITSQVKWRQSVIKLKEKGVNQIIEIGSGKVLTGLAKRIDKEIEASNVGSIEDMNNFLAKL